MRILSLNVNDFGGTDQKPRYDSCRKNPDLLSIFRSAEQRIRIARDIATRILEYRPSLILLQEFDLHSPAGQYILTAFINSSYSPVYPNAETADTFGNASITLMFVKNPEKYKALPSPEGSKAWRWCQLHLSGWNIIGLHLSYDLPFWDALIREYQNSTMENQILIGDFNAADHPNSYAGTLSKVKFDKLLDSPALDVWTERSFPRDTPTFAGGTRIDHVVVSPNAYGRIKNILLDSTFLQRQLTDHAAFIVDF